MALVFTCLSHGLWAQSGGVGVWQQAQEAIQHDRLSEAIPLLELTLAQDPGNADALRFLAAAQEQTGDLAGAIATLEAGSGQADLADTQRARVNLDLGLLRARHGEHAAAASSYSSALQLDSALTQAYLNRANAHVATGAYDDALRDYQYYVALVPATSQRADIDAMIVLLQQSIEARRIAEQEAERERERIAEAERVAAEEAERQAEQARQQREEEARLAAQRREQLLSSVLESLGAANDDAASFEVQNESLRTFDDSLDIVD